MKRTLAITAATAALALSLAACGASRGGSGTSGISGTTTTPSGIDGTTAMDTMRDETGGAAANTDTAKNGLGVVTGAINSGREPTRYGMTHDDAYAAANNGGVSAETRYKLMMENARVHDKDGFLLDGENASYRTF